MKKNSPCFFSLLQMVFFPGMKLGIPQWLKYSHIPTPPPSSAQCTLTLLITKYVLLWRTNDSIPWHMPTKNVFLIPCSSGELRCSCVQDRSTPAFNCGSQLIATWGCCRFPKTGSFPAADQSCYEQRTLHLNVKQKQCEWVSGQQLSHINCVYFRSVAVLSQPGNKGHWRLWQLASLHALTWPRVHAANCRWWVWPHPWVLS